jgi:hypothetical protein
MSVVWGQLLRHGVAQFVNSELEKDAKVTNSAIVDHFDEQYAPLQQWSEDTAHAWYGA